MVSARLPRATTARGETPLSRRVCAGLVGETYRCRNRHPQVREQASPPRRVPKAPLTNFIPDVGKLDGQLFLLHKGTFVLEKQKRTWRVPRFRLHEHVHTVNDRVPSSKCFRASSPEGGDFLVTLAREDGAKPSPRHV